jgi:hypothetical protein
MAGAGNGLKGLNAAGAGIGGLTAALALVDYDPLRAPIWPRRNPRMPRIPADITRATASCAEPAARFTFPSHNRSSDAARVASHTP